MPLILEQDVEFSSPVSMQETQGISLLGGAPHDTAIDQTLPPTISSDSTGARTESQSTQTSYRTAWRRERKLLIIGAGHDASIRLDGYTTPLQQLSGVENDRDNLRFVFQQREYSVQTMVTCDFDRDQLLQRVRDFLRPAVAGDVRAIVFTGHGIVSVNGGEVAIVPKICSSAAQAIPASLWNATLRESTRPGVVVLSILATCHSGGVLERGVNLTDFNQLRERPHTTSLNEPTIIAFSSSSASETSYELPAPTLHSPGNAGWHDMLLWALARTMGRAEVQDWDTFVEVLQKVFDDVRAAGARYVEDRSPYHYTRDWLNGNRQTPQVASSHHPMPDFPHVLPPLT